MTPEAGLWLLLVLAVSCEAMVVLAWLVERLAHALRIDIGCPDGCRCHGRRRGR